MYVYTHTASLMCHMCVHFHKCSHKTCVQESVPNTKFLSLTHAGTYMDPDMCEVTCTVAL